MNVIVALQNCSKGLPPNTCNIGSLKTIGWKSMESEIAIISFTFLWQLLLLPISNVYKRLCIMRICKMVYNENVQYNSPMFSIVQLCKKYSKMCLAHQAITRGENMSKQKWKSLINYCVADYEQKFWSVKQKFYKSLSLPHNENNISCVTWWVHAYFLQEMCQ